MSIRYCESYRRKADPGEGERGLCRVGCSFENQSARVVELVVNREEKKRKSNESKADGEGNGSWRVIRCAECAN